MIDIKVPINDWITLIFGLAGFLSACYAQKSRLPAWVRVWLKRIGDKKVLDAVQRAASITELSSEEKRRYAVLCLQKVSMKQLGFPIPSSIANLLVEHIYQKWKRTARK
ncbi:MAG: hypothetical protein SNJ70_09525 [Armatimonadota bacterium]